MKTILLAVLCILLIANNVLALSIIKPQKGDTYLVGQTLTIELQALPEEDVEQLIINTNHFDGAVITSAPFKHDFRLDQPVDGQEKIGIVGVLKNGKTILLSTYIYVKLPADIDVKDILFEENSIVVIMTPIESSTDAILANGIFSDGSTYPLSSYSQTKYQSIDESIAKVDSNGVVTGVYPGRTTVKVTAGNITKEIKVKVIYKLDPIKGITVTTLEKSNEIKWEKSPYEGEIVSDYRIYRSKDYEGVGKVLIGTVPAGTTAFTDTKPVAGVKYYYSVQTFSQKFNAGSSMKGLWVVPVAGLPPAN